MEFFQTQMGHKFYESTMPRIAEALEDISKKLESRKQSVYNEEIVKNVYERLLTAVKMFTNGDANAIEAVKTIFELGGISVGKSTTPESDTPEPADNPMYVPKYSQAYVDDIKRLAFKLAKIVEAEGLEPAIERFAKEFPEAIDWSEIVKD